VCDALDKAALPAGALTLEIIESALDATPDVPERLGRIRRDSNVWWNSAPHDLSILFHLVPRPVTQVGLPPEA